MSVLPLTQRETWVVFKREINPKEPFALFRFFYGLRAINPVAEAATLERTRKYLPTSVYLWEGNTGQYAEDVIEIWFGSGGSQLVILSMNSETLQHGI